MKLKLPVFSGHSTSHYSLFPESCHPSCLIIIRQVLSVSECLVHKCLEWDGWSVQYETGDSGEHINWRHIWWQKTIRSYVAFVSTYAQGRECTYPAELGQEAVPRKGKFKWKALGYFYLNVNECEKRKALAQILGLHREIKT